MFGALGLPRGLVVASANRKACVSKMDASVQEELGGEEKTPLPMCWFLCWMRRSTSSAEYAYFCRPPSVPWECRHRHVVWPSAVALRPWQYEESCGCYSEVRTPSVPPSFTGRGDIPCRHGKWLMLLSCLALSSSVNWSREKKKKSLHFFLLFFFVSASSLYGQTGSCSQQDFWLARPMDPDSRCLRKHDCHRKCSTCFTALQLSEMVPAFFRSPPRLVLTLAAQPSGGCPESTTLWVWEQ